MSEHYREMDRAKRSDVLKKLVSQASFLRMVVPRRPGDGSITGARFVFRDGGIVEDSSISDGIRVASSVMDLNDARVKHHQLLKRQHYGREPPAYDPRSF
ncbi:hypothetical protein H632_c2785p1 [Helicosporidium sp. ATCC 50920]|nr:hypothetical protein H632_c2785p1 [Helicosporidium sp. ATCC 50920]|eukprot:KDD72877.1 hypothetical protein H632_c2785p1 [Helicosporidium sp. ATCC 50920]